MLGMLLKLLLWPFRFVTGSSVWQSKALYLAPADAWLQRRWCLWLLSLHWFCSSFGEQPAQIFPGLDEAGTPQPGAAPLLALQRVDPPNILVAKKPAPPVLILPDMEEIPIMECT